MWTGKLVRGWTSFVFARSQQTEKQVNFLPKTINRPQNQFKINSEQIEGWKGTWEPPNWNHFECMHEFHVKTAEGNVIAIRNRAEPDLSANNTCSGVPAAGIDGKFSRDWIIDSRIREEFLQRVDQRRRFFEFRVNRQTTDLEARPSLIIRVWAGFPPSFSCCRDDSVWSAIGIRKKVLRTTQNLFNNTSRYDCCETGLISWVILYRFE